MSKKLKKKFERSKEVVKNKKQLKYVLSLWAANSIGWVLELFLNIYYSFLLYFSLGLVGLNTFIDSFNPALKNFLFVLAFILLLDEVFPKFKSILKIIYNVK